MRPGLKKALGSYGLYILLAAAVIISAAVTAVLQSDRERSVVIYSASQNEDQDESSRKDSSRTEKKSAKNTSSKKAKTSSSKAPKEKQTKVTTTKAPKKTAAAKTTTERSSKETTTALEVDFPLDINLATAEEIMAIDGIGEATAADILSFRDSRGIIHNMDELLEISGIGQSKLKLLKEYLYVDEADYMDITAATETTAEKATETVPATETAAPPMTEPDTTQTDEPEATEPTESLRQPVNINTADAETIAESLLLDNELAEEIVSTREKLGGAYENYLQLLYVNGISKELLSELKDYILLE